MCDQGYENGNLGTYLFMPFAMRAIYMCDRVRSMTRALSSVRWFFAHLWALVCTDLPSTRVKNFHPDSDLVGSIRFRSDLTEYSAALIQAAERRMDRLTKTNMPAPTTLICP